MAHAKRCLHFQDVAFGYESASTLPFENLAMELPVGWTGIIGSSGSVIWEMPPIRKGGTGLI